MFKLTTQSGKLAVEVEKVRVQPLLYHPCRTVMSTCQWDPLILVCCFPWGLSWNSRSRCVKLPCRQGIAGEAFEQDFGQCILERV